MHLLVRGKRMRASAAMQDRALRHDKVQVHFNTSVRDAYGDKKGLKGLVLYDTDSGVGARRCRLFATPLDMHAGYYDGAAGQAIIGACGEGHLACSVPPCMRCFSVSAVAVRDAWRRRAEGPEVPQGRRGSWMCAGCFTASGTSPTAVSWRGR